MNEAGSHITNLSAIQIFFLPLAIQIVVRFADFRLSFDSFFPVSPLCVNVKCSPPVVATEIEIQHNDVLNINIC